MTTNTDISGDCVKDKTLSALRDMIYARAKPRRPTQASGLHTVADRITAWLRAPPLRRAAGGRDWVRGPCLFGRRLFADWRRAHLLQRLRVDQPRDQRMDARTAAGRKGFRRSAPDG